MIDFHAHTLPFADHGCPNTDTAARQLPLAVAAGVEVLCVTPHFYPHRHTMRVFDERKATGKAEIAGLDVAKPRLLYGAEVLLCEGMEEMDRVKDLCVEGTNVMLLELPDRPFNRDLALTVQALIDMGICPVYAHIERYPAATREAALRVSPRAQMNLCDIPGFLHAGFAKKLAKSGMLVALGSDVHGDDDAWRCLPAVRKALGSFFDEAEAQTRALLAPALMTEAK